METPLIIEAQAGHPVSVNATATLSSITSGVDTFVGVENNTLYIQNLNERARLKDLRAELIKIFGKYGAILNVSVKKSLKMRGQAHIVYEHIESARAALAACQGSMLYYKPIVIKYAKFKSDSIAIREGCLEDEKAKRLANQLEKAKHPRLTRRQLMMQLMSTHSGLSLPAPMLHPQLPSTSDMGLPNKILFVQNIPADLPPSTLDELFSRFPGFLELRMVPTKVDICFVEFENEVFANTARLATDRYKISPAQEIRVNFAKK